MAIDWSEIDPFIGTMPAQELGRRVGVSRGAIYLRSNKLGIPIAGRGRPGIVWTPSMDATIVDLNISAKKASEILGVSYQSVYMRRYKLGHVRTKEQVKKARRDISKRKKSVAGLIRTGGTTRSGSWDHLIGVDFNRLTLRRILPTTFGNCAVKGEFDCDCGNKCVVIITNWTGDLTKSCGCLAKEYKRHVATHGLRTPFVPANLTLAKKALDVGQADAVSVGVAAPVNSDETAVAVKEPAAAVAGLGMDGAVVDLGVPLASVPEVADCSSDFWDELAPWEPPCA